MPSFDIVSEIELQQVRNAVENANREVSIRFDFRNVIANIELNEKEEIIKITSESNFQIGQLVNILRENLIKRGIETKAIEIAKEVNYNGKLCIMQVKLKNGIDRDVAKDLLKVIKKSKLKVQFQIQGNELRIIGKSRDILQRVIILVRNHDFNQPFQFKNFRD
ncbi:YajQ family cyclic di-GMP-binding protein [Candidatus Pantoea carbekii]|uniref:Nucleotide-binding protein HHS_07990 n=1 Tax=Candidatus Pantoea carbekii TaxID=1235990 RepID=U3U8P3_9GAMM|nr:YajQ family cyclic di-GMP-binding protein [Candidatus Pantoea carbekii]AKC32233.1 hypothetical protein BMSBPS_0433 [Candidatus Pantoea carbekii]BAO00769.1 hypothetical protein HHS_07990 [Candidatus Pantoea carbekii]